MKRHAFLDLETLGTGPAPALVEIGLVIFDEKQILDHVYERLQWDVDLEAGGQIDPDCLCWWMQDPKRSRELAEMTFRAPIPRTLARAYQLCGRWNAEAAWANGCDWGWLEAALRRHKMPKFWGYNAVRDLRTLRKTVCAGIDVGRDEATMHNALEDALWGARLLQEMHRQKGGIL